tara:strand:+ start:229 stop:411 length:183 start_codon:yes stop_codon:yes gene_type:complete
MYVCQSIATAGVAVGELLVVESTDVEQGGMEVMHMDPLVGYGDTILIGLGGAKQKNETEG